jgi:hypothetical protein
MTVSSIQDKFAEASTNGGSITISPTSAFTAGSALNITCTFGDDTSTATCSDGVNTYSASQSMQRDTTNHQSMCRFEANNIASGTPTITVTFSGTPNFRGVHLSEVGGAAASAADGTAGNTQASPGTGTDAVTSTTVTNTNQPALLVGVAIDSSGAFGAPAAGTGFTALNNGWGFGGSNLARAETKRFTDTTGHAATFTAVGNDIHMTVAGMFDEAAAAGGGVTLPELERGIRGLERGMNYGRFH